MHRQWLLICSIGMVLKSFCESLKIKHHSRKKIGGFFIEAGAAFGVKLSNTLLFEVKRQVGFKLNFILSKVPACSFSKKNVFND